MSCARQRPSAWWVRSRRWLPALLGVALLGCGSSSPEGASAPSPASSAVPQTTTTTTDPNGPLTRAAFLKTISLSSAHETIRRWVDPGDSSWDAFYLSVAEGLCTDLEGARSTIAVDQVLDTRAGDFFGSVMLATGENPGASFRRAIDDIFQLSIRYRCPDVLKIDAESVPSGEPTTWSGQLTPPPVPITSSAALLQQVTTSGVTCEPETINLAPPLVTQPVTQGCSGPGVTASLIVGDSSALIRPLVEVLISGQICAADFFSAYPLLGEPNQGGGGTYRVVAGDGWAVGGLSLADATRVADRLSGEVIERRCSV